MLSVGPGISTGGSSRRILADRSTSDDVVAGSFWTGLATGVFLAFRCFGGLSANLELCPHLLFDATFLPPLCDSDLELVRFAARSSGCEGVRPFEFEYLVAFCTFGHTRLAAHA